VKIKQYALFYLLVCDLTIVVWAWSEPVSTEMIVTATVIKSCRISTKHELTTAGSMQNGEWFSPTAVDNREGSCPTGSLPLILVEPKSHHPIINADSLNDLQEESGQVIHTEVIFTDTPSGLGAKATHQVLDTPQNSNFKRISEIGPSVDGKPSVAEQDTLRITIHF
jgi:hypothetical protein